MERFNEITLTKKANKIIRESEGKISPRLFRVKLGISKQTLSQWKNSSKEETYAKYLIIKKFEDLLLANIEQMVIYGNVKNTQGLIFTLKAYDTFYREAANVEQAPIVINIPKTSEKDQLIPTYRESEKNVSKYS